MCTAVDQPSTDSIEGSAAGNVAEKNGPNPSDVRTGTPVWLRVTRATVGWTALLGLLYLVLSHHPLYHTDLWGHLSYGRWIWENGRLPQTEPLLPLSAGVPMVDTAWLSQVIGFGMYRQFGVTALQFLFAAPITAAFAILLWGVLQRTRGSVVAGLVAMGTFGWVDYQQLLIVRPQLNGLLMFVVLFVLMNVCCWRRHFWVIVPVMFALWANLHGSWIVGLGLLGAMCAGRAFDVGRRTMSVKAMIADPVARRLFVLTTVCAVSVLFNPYGIDLYSAVFAISGNPNLQDLIEWEPLTLRMSQGQAAAATALALMFVYRLSPRRVTASEVLLLVGLGAAALWFSRMIHWWAPVAAYYVAVHAASVGRRWRRSEWKVPTRSGLMTIVALGLVAITFACTPFGFTLIQGRPETESEQRVTFSRSTSPLTPIAAVEYLQDNPVNGLVYNTFEWGDFLQFVGPRNLRLFTNSHAHLVPREVWTDSLSILRASSGWNDKLDRYGVNALVLNAYRDAALVRALEGKPDTWELAFERGAVIIFRRRSSA